MATRSSDPYWQRIRAILCDLASLLLVCIPGLFLAFYDSMGNNRMSGVHLAVLIVPAVSLVIPEMIAGWAIGKRQFRLRVVRRDGTQASTASLVVRACAKYWMPFYGLLSENLFPGYTPASAELWMPLIYSLQLFVSVWQLLYFDCRMVHEIISGTRVIPVSEARGFDVVMSPLSDISNGPHPQP